MNYKLKRNRAKLDTYTVSKLLGIKEKTYKEVEKGLRNLEGDKIDKFFEIIDNAKEIRLDNMQKEPIIDEWIASGKAKEDIKEMGYNEKSFAEAIDYAQPTINQILNSKRQGSFGVKCAMYDFLHDPLNKNIETKKNVKKDTENTEKKDTENTEKEVLSLVDEPVINTFYTNELEQLKEENKKLRKQVERYEKLIDRL